MTTAVVITLLIAALGGALIFCINGWVGCSARCAQWKQAAETAQSALEQWRKQEVEHAQSAQDHNANYDPNNNIQL